MLEAPEYQETVDDDKRNKPIPLGYQIIGICGAINSKETPELAFRDFLIWKPPGSLMVKLRDFVINPSPPGGIKVV